MSKPPDNNAALQYLLGALPETEMARLDEMSFADEGFAQALQAAEKDLVDAYVQGELSGAALESFKTHYLASPIRRQKLSFAQAFQEYAEKDADALAAVVQSKHSAEAKARRSGSSWLTSLGNFLTPRFAMQWGLAFAVLALLIGGSWLVVENVRLRQRASEAPAQRDALSQREQKLQKALEGQRAANAAAEQELARVRQERERLEQELAAQHPHEGPSPSAAGSILALVLTPQLRGSGQVPSISIPAKTAYVAARLRLDPNDYTAYKVAVVDEHTSNTVWRSGTLKAKAAGGNKTLSAKLPADVLKPGQYVIRVSGVSSEGTSETVDEYVFRVAKK